MNYWPGAEEKTPSAGAIVVRPPSPWIDRAALGVALYLFYKGKHLEGVAAGIGWYELYKKRLIAEGIYKVFTGETP